MAGADNDHAMARRWLPVCLARSVHHQSRSLAGRCKTPVLQSEVATDGCITARARTCTNAATFAPAGAHKVDDLAPPAFEGSDRVATAED